ncbi:hypothetical protein ACTJKO_14795 [Curtobacterium sp. 22159]|uniref:hypothetical protein n=1 Tax=Curtobacterium sp. 22159 TaxID=3453882 RepID=UPI003F863876
MNDSTERQGHRPIILMIGGTVFIAVFGVLLATLPSGPTLPLIFIGFGVILLAAGAWFRLKNRKK